MQYYMKLVRAFPLRSFATKSEFDEGQKVFRELHARGTELRPGEQAYATALSGLMREYERNARARKSVAARPDASEASSNPIPPNPRQSAVPHVECEADLFDAFLTRLSPKDRQLAQRHTDVCEAEVNPNHVDLWRRLAGTLSALAPLSAKLLGARHVQFFIRDGKYRMQVFALQDLRDGKLTVYCRDILAEAIASRVLSPDANSEDPGRYLIGETQRDLYVETLNKNTIHPDLFFKDMIGWNRKAMRVAILTTADEQDIRAVEKLCTLAVS